MIIKNNRKVKFQILIYAALFIMEVILLSLYVSDIFPALEKDFLIVIVLSLMPILYLRLKGFNVLEYDSSGEVLCMKSCNLLPLKKDKASSFEMPKAVIRSCKTEHSFFKRFLVLHFTTGSGKKMVKYFDITNYSHHQAKMLENNILGFIKTNRKQ